MDYCSGIILVWIGNDESTYFCIVDTTSCCARLLQVINVEQAQTTVDINTVVHGRH